MSRRSLFERIVRAMQTGMWLLIRQSGGYQRDHNKGSALVQKEQARYLTPFGARLDDIHVVDARGESGTAGAHRRLFSDLLAAARRGEVGVLLLARHDRLGRADDNSSALFDALRKSRSLIMVDGRVFDPCEAGDNLHLHLQSSFAEYENAARTKWMQTARWALAKQGAYRVPLASGLVWASPDDPRYVRAMRDAGLGDWLDRLLADPAGYRACASVAGEIDNGLHPSHARQRRYYPLPLPDAQVVRSAELRIRWLLETRSLREVMRRIGAPNWDHPQETDTRPLPCCHPDWPMAGRIPVFRGRGKAWTPDDRARWTLCTWSTLRNWYTSPSIFGIYAASSVVVETDQSVFEHDGHGSSVDGDTASDPDDEGPSGGQLLATSGSFL